MNKPLKFTSKTKDLDLVNLSKKILPNQDSYSLGNLCEDLQIGIQNPHRAEDDAKATVELFKILLDNDPNNYIEAAITEKNLYTNAPKHLSAELVHSLPEETGIYFLHNVNGKVIFVGKSADIQRRIIQHINNNTTSKKKLYKMLQNTHNVTYKETGSELLASLLESYEIQRLRPSYNRLRRARRPKYGIFKYYHPTKHYLHIKIQEIQAEEVPIIAFPKKGTLHLISVIFFATVPSSELVNVIWPMIVAGIPTISMDIFPEYGPPNLPCQVSF